MELLTRTEWEAEICLSNYPKGTKFLAITKQELGLLHRALYKCSCDSYTEAQAGVLTELLNLVDPI